jgi:hypothetical protein
MLSPELMSDRKSLWRIASKGVGCFGELNSSRSSSKLARAKIPSLGRLAYDGTTSAKSRSENRCRRNASVPVQPLLLCKARHAAPQQFRYCHRPCPLKGLELTPAHLIVGDKKMLDFIEQRRRNFVQRTKIRALMLGDGNGDYAVISKSASVLCLFGFDYAESARRHDATGAGRGIHQDKKYPEGRHHRPKSMV